MTTPIFVFGAGPQGRVALDILQSRPGTEVAGFLDDRQELAGTQVSGVPVFHAAGWLASGPRLASITIAIGNNLTRMAVGQRLMDAGHALHTAIHNSATIASDAEIGRGSLICMQAAVCTGCRLGLNVVINTGATLDHDSVVEDGGYVSPGVHSAGSVRIGANAFVGVGAILLPGVRIGSRAVVGAGSIVTQDVPPNTLCYGAPARVRRIIDGDLDWAKILGGKPR
jgi:acetyltransferase EpsM